MIAMALSCNPELLIADEPTTALDVTIQKQILDLLRRLRDERGMSILFITHDLGVIAEIADDVAVMYRGKLVEYDRVDRIFANPQHPYTKGLLACRPKLGSTYKRLATVSDFMTTKKLPDGSYEIIEKAMTPERIDVLTNKGRGRMLHPKSELQAIGHPWEEGRHPPGTTSVAEGEQPLLAVKDLKVYFPIRKGVFRRTVGHVKAVDGVSFNVYRGQTLGLVGESGCGKTTAGPGDSEAHQADAAARCDSTASTSPACAGPTSRQLRSRMQIIFQDPYSSLNPRMTVEGMLVEPMSRASTRHRPGPIGETGPPDCWKRSDWSRITCGGIRTSSPAGNGNGSRSPGRWRSNRSSSSATSRSRHSTSRCRLRCSICSRICRKNAG